VCNHFQIPVDRCIDPPHDSRLPDRLQDPTFFLYTFVAAAVLTRAELATRMLQHYWLTVKPDELVQLKPFEETDCLKLFKFINSNNLSIRKYLICFQVTQ